MPSRQDFNDKANRERWLAVSEQIKTGAMPPEGKPRPTEKDVTALADWISGRVATAEAARNAAQGRVADAPAQPGRVREHRARPARRGHST